MKAKVFGVRKMVGQRQTLKNQQDIVGPQRIICSERADKELRLEPTKCSVTRSHAVGAGVSVSSAITYGSCHGPR